MKALLSISLSVLLLLQSVNFGVTDLLRLDGLVEHVQLHSESYGDSFFDFLTKHYGSSKKDHLTAHEGHEDLPFKHDVAKATINIYVVGEPQIFDFTTPPVLHPQVTFFYTNSYTSQTTDKIFQPPIYA